MPISPRVRAFLFTALSWVLVGNVASWALVLDVGCGPSSPGPKPVPPTTEGDCTTACARMRQLHCPEGDPTPKGASCEAVCNEFRDKPAGIDPVCMTAVTTCSQVDQCGR